ncbi:MAG: hypothetical protein VXW26_17530 [SAR324 cluster bacterium]|nr:hypothetical protein [SAR324 cluster bacterium]
MSCVLLGTQGMSCLEHRKCPACGNIDPKNTTSLETMASWALKNRARKMTIFLRGMINMFGAETIFRDFRWSIGSVLLGTQGMSSPEHKECPASNTGNVLLGTQGMFCFEHTECSASNTWNVLL